MLRAVSHYLAGPSTAAAGVQQQLLAAGAIQAQAVWGSIDGFTADAFNSWLGKRWATKKQGGSTKNKPDRRAPKHLGAKMFDGQLAFPGQILVRQRGYKFKPGHNVGSGVDQTLFSKTVGFVKYRTFIEEHPYQPQRPAKTRRVIDVLPLNDEWGPEYKHKVDAMVAARNALREQRLGMRAVRARH